MKGVDTYQGRGLIADPIHQYILYTRPDGAPGEATEQDLIDSAWMQRLRRVPQLQSARWVFPAAEHSRFQHSLGAMHLAGRFAQQLHASLKAEFSDAPSAPLFEELLRMAGLLHDVGHGPFGHFFDDNFLADFDLTHEKVGQRIIREELGELIRGLRRSPSGPFENGERIDPEWICYLMGKSYTIPHRRASRAGSRTSSRCSRASTPPTTWTTCCATPTCAGWRWGRSTSSGSCTTPSSARRGSRSTAAASRRSSCS